MELLAATQIGLKEELETHYVILLMGRIAWERSVEFIVRVTQTICAHIQMVSSNKKQFVFHMISNIAITVQFRTRNNAFKKEILKTIVTQWTELIALILSLDGIIHMMDLLFLIYHSFIHLRRTMEFQDFIVTLKIHTLVIDLMELFAILRMEKIVQRIWI